MTVHDIVIGAPRDMVGGGRPAILQRTDNDFIESTLDDLRTPAGRQSLASLRATTKNDAGTLKLFQPVQRQFHLALIEAWCDTPGGPRIDPSRVESAGMVLRRLGANGRPEGWMRSKGRVRGWVAIDRVGGDAADPVSPLRLQGGLTGVAGIDYQLTTFALQNTDSLLDETVIPLYVAPPDVCGDAAKTVYYGLVPTVSSELCEAAPVFGSATDSGFFGPQTEAFRQHLVEALRGETMDLPFPGEAVVGGWFDASEMPGDTAPAGVSADQWDELKNPDSASSRSLRRFVLLLRQLSSEFNAFEGGDEVAELKAILQGIRLPLILRDGETVHRTVPAHSFLDRACRVLLQKEAVDGTVEMPESWPALSNDLTTRLKAAMHTAMQARFMATKGKAGRYDEPDARYALRAFVRLKPEGPCPTRIVWSEYSEPFVIAPWYEGAGAPPVQIPLPDLSDPKLLRALKPNVAFVVPPAMQNLLSGKAKDLLEGKGGVGTLGISWICSFNIPSITICAFIVLNIFLSLLNIVFGWLFFIKICIPFPKFGDKPPGGTP